MNETKLLPCPFCGAEGQNVGTLMHYVACTDDDCGAAGPPRWTESEAAEAWNTRPPAGAS